MKKTIINTVLAGVAAATIGGTAAQASTLDSVAGNVKFLYDGLDAAQSTYALTGSAGVICTGGVAACDAASASPSSAGTNDASDTWGLTRVSSIKDKDNLFASNLWNSGDDNEVLFAYFHGFQDIHVEELTSGRVEIFSAGGEVDIYRVDTAFSVPALADQTALEALFAGEELYLSLDFQAGCSLTHASATLCGEFTLDSTTLAGGSNGSAIATGGTAFDKYPSTFDFIQSVRACTSSCAGTSFNVEVFDGSAITTALPEPGALGLLGLGLVGLGLAGRRRKAA